MQLKVLKCLVVSVVVLCVWNVRAQVTFNSDIAFSVAADTATKVVSQNEMVCTSGTLLYKEDFGGNSPTDPPFRTTPLAQITGIEFHSNGNPQYGYAIRKYGYNARTWYNQNQLDDHTYPNVIGHLKKRHEH